MTGENPYSDVPAGSYYEKAVIWAMQKGVANGMGGGKFEPDARVTRQQAVTMLYRYAVKIADIRTDERARARPLHRQREDQCLRDHRDALGCRLRPDEGLPRTIRCSRTAH